MSIAIGMPMTIVRPKPPSVASVVFQLSLSRRGHSATNCLTTSHGGGIREAGISKSRITRSHSASSNRSSRNGRRAGQSRSLRSMEATPIFLAGLCRLLRDLQACGLPELGVARDLLLDVGVELLGPERPGVGAEPEETLLHLGRGQGLDHLVVQALDDRARCLGGGPHADPEVELPAGHAGLGGGGHLGQGGGPLGRTHGQRQQLPIPDLADDRCDGREVIVHPPRQHFGHGFGRAFERDVGGLDPGGEPELFGVQMRGAALAGRGEIDAARPGPGGGQRRLQRPDVLGGGLYPGGGARRGGGVARACCPMVPLAPLRLSTTRLCPMLWPILSAMARAMMSVVLPAANGTITRIGFFWWVCCARAPRNTGGGAGGWRGGPARRGAPVHGGRWERWAWAWIGLRSPVWQAVGCRSIHLLVNRSAFFLIPACASTHSRAESSGVYPQAQRKAAYGVARGLGRAPGAGLGGLARRPSCRVTDRMSQADR